jgi:hypothetical protein
VHRSRRLVERIPGLVFLDRLVVEGVLVFAGRQDDEEEEAARKKKQGNLVFHYCGFGLRHDILKPWTPPRKGISEGARS